MKIVFLDNKSYIVRCCGLDSYGIRTELNISPEQKNSEESLRKAIFESAYKVPKNIVDIPQSVGCKAHCIEAFTPGEKLKSVNLGLPTCNLACPTCRNEQILKVNEDTLDTYFKTLYALKGIGIEVFCPNLSGEPFFYKEKIKEWLKSLKPGDFGNILFITNLTILNDEDIQCLVDVNKKVPIHIMGSVDSVIEETFMKLRFPSTNKMFRTALENIDKLKKAGIYVDVSITISDTNSSEKELTSYGEYFKERGVEINAVVAFQADDKFGYLRTDPVVLDFVKKYNVNLRST